MPSINRRQLTTGVAFAALMAFAPRAFAAEIADIIYSGGTILTMKDGAPRAEAVAVKGGRIIATGAAADVMKLKGPNTKLIDLKGRTMLPGFIDPHGHVTLGGLMGLSANLLPPPDGTVNSIAALQGTFRDYIKANAERIKLANVVIGFGYDPAQLKEQRNPTKQELDAVTTEFPVVAIHQSGHIATFNSKALQLAGYTAATPNPPGGVIVRMAGSNEPNGVLEEAAWLGSLSKVFGNIGPTGLVALAKAGIELWSSYGYTTAQEGRATPGLATVLKSMADKGELPIDVAVYLDTSAGKEYTKANVSQNYVSHFRVAGGKLVIDGTPQGFTAWRDRPYYDPVGNYPPDYKGVHDVSNQEVMDTYEWSYANGIQVLTHSNGEGASDLLIAAIKNAQKKYGKLPVRPVLIHGQFQREDQVDSFVEMGVFPSLFPMHCYYWGDWHRDHTVGPVHGDNISPTGWYRKRGSMFTTHSDAPVTYPDTMRVLSATVNRRTRSGDILGPAQRVPADVALKAMTLWAAVQYGEEANKGSIEVGKIADFVILTKDPTATDPDKLDDIKVAETIKEGISVYVASPEKLQKKASLGKGMDNPVSDFLNVLMAQRELKELPPEQRTAEKRLEIASSPLEMGCVGNIVFDITRTILGDEDALDLA
jgi:predicted amidohydrolase YtcJ